MKDKIKKILRESESDWTWTEENQINVPLEDIVSWCDNNRDLISTWIQRIDEFYENSPKVNWNDKTQYSNQTLMLALSIKGIGDELRNIYNSFDTIDGEIDYIKNPSKYDD